MKRSTKALAFLDRFYKRFCCGARNHPSGWKKDKCINRRTVRRKLKDELRDMETDVLDSISEEEDNYEHK